jgi:hypothetical protein
VSTSSELEAWAVASNCVEAVLEATPGAFPRLVERVWPLLIDLGKSSRALRASASPEDDAREIATRLIEKLKRDDHAALRSYRDWQGRHPDQGFADWMRIATANAIRDLLRQRRGSRDAGRDSRDPSIKQLLNEHALLLVDDALSTRPPFTPVHTARQILDYADKRLPPSQVAALHHWLSEHTFDDIAKAQSLESGLDAKRLVRAAVASLRRAFADDPSSPAEL